MAFDEPLFTAMTPKGYVLVHGRKIVAHERWMIWGGMFVKGKKFYLTGKVNPVNNRGNSKPSEVKIAASCTTRLAEST